MKVWKGVIVIAALGSTAALAGAFAARPDRAAASARRREPPRSHPDVRMGKVELPGGVSLHYAESGPDDGEPMILLHGFSDSWFSFSRLLPLLPEHVHAFALDQRGHGDSDRPRTGYAPPDLAADVVAFMDTKGIERATIVGHSMGGFVAQWLAAEAPERVARLVVIASASVPRAFAGLDRFEREVEALEDPVPAEFVRAFQESTLHVPVAPEFLNEVVAESLKLPAYVWRGVMTGLVEAPAPPVSAERRIPTLVLWGEHDAYAPRAEQDVLVERHRTALLRIYRDTGHAPHWERPEEVATDLRAFLRTEPARQR